MKIALVQLDIRWESKKTNYKRAEEFIQKASHEKCDIVVFPEMFNTGFSMNVSAIVEDKDGETAAMLSGMAKRYEINLIAGFPVKAFGDKKGKNIAVVFNRSGKNIASYIKIHPFSFATEDQYYVAGNDTVIFNIEGMSSGIFICYDLRFPEVFRSIAKDVQAIFVIANWPASRKEHWVTLLKARAIENQCFVIGVNRTGTDGNEIYYPGDSRVFSPLGIELCSGNNTDEFLTCIINPNEVTEIRAKFPFLNDMRIFRY